KLEVEDLQAGHTVICPQCKSQNPVPGNIPHMGIVCNNCRNEMHIDVSLGGTMQRCPNCGSMVAVPEIGEKQVFGGCMNLMALLVAVVTTGAVGLVYLIRG